MAEMRRRPPASGAGHHSVRARLSLKPRRGAQAKRARSGGVIDRGGGRPERRIGNRVGDSRFRRAGEKRRALESRKRSAGFGPKGCALLTPCWSRRVRQENRTERRIALHQVADGVAVEHGEERRLGLGENSPVDAARSDPAVALAAGEALSERNRPLGVPRDGGHRIHFRQAGEPEPAAPAAHRLDKPGAAEPPDDPGQVALRYPVSISPTVARPSR